MGHCVHHAQFWVRWAFFLSNFQTSTIEILKYLKCQHESINKTTTHLIHISFLVSWLSQLFLFLVSPQT